MHNNCLIPKINPKSFNWLEKNNAIKYKQLLMQLKMVNANKLYQNYQVKQRKLDLQVNIS